MHSYFEKEKNINDKVDKYTSQIFQNHTIKSQRECNIKNIQGLKRLLTIHVSPLKIISMLDRKTVNISFGTSIRYPGKPDHQRWYLQKICIYCIHLNNEILSAVTDTNGKNSNSFVYSPAQYASVRHRVKKEEDFRDPFVLDAANPHSIEFSCQVMLTSRDTPYSDLEYDV